jgi:hypothetical protein
MLRGTLPHHAQDPQPLLSTVLRAAQKHASADLSTADIDTDLRDLHIHGRRCFELAGELSEVVGLPGDTDDAVNVAIIEQLARSTNIRELTNCVARFLPAGPDVPRCARAWV